MTVFSEEKTVETFHEVTEKINIKKTFKTKAAANEELISEIKIEANNYEKEIEVLKRKIEILKGMYK